MNPPVRTKENGASRRVRPAAGAALAALALVAAAPASAGPSGRSKNVQATLVSEVESIRPGTPFTVGLRLQMDEGWHTYWKNPGDSGLPTRFTWRLPEGFAAGEIQWPHPERIPFGPLVSYGYEGEVLLPVAITPPASLAPGSDVRVAARVDWLECKEICLPGKAELDFTLPVSESAPLPAPEVAPLFAEARAQLPVPAEGWSARSAAADGRVLLALGPPAGIPLPAEAYFFPEQAEVVDFAAPQTLAATASGFRLEMKAVPNPIQPFPGLTGVLVVRGSQGRPLALAIESTVDPAVLTESAVAATMQRGGLAGLPVALAFAFLGGIILNLMPCVLPVLSLKVMSFIRHGGEDPRRAFRHGLAYTLGVLAFFWLLAGALLALRAAGQQVGWGFQLQQPGFVVFLTCLFFVLALNLFGVFEVGESLTTAGGYVQRQSGLAASFWAGALATIVATPCTAPFMGSALGFALSQPAWSTLAIFSFLGLGMAAPYLLLSRFTGLLRYVPKPGAWMEAFKQLMGFLLLATVVFLLWLFGRQAGIDAMTLLLAGLLAIGMGAWIYGRGTAPGRSGRARLLASLGAAALAVAGLALGFSQAQAAPAATRAKGVAETDGIAWEPFSPERVAELRAAGTPVFIDFTADWCLSCQVNERVAFSSEAVRERFRAEGVAMIKADWTLHDDRITQALAGYGRQGVPLYVLYGRDPQAPPRILPELISPTIVISALDEVFPKS